MERSKEAVTQIYTSSKRACNDLYPAAMREDLIENRSVSEVGTVALVPDHAVEETRSKECDENVPNDVDYSQTVPFLKSGKVI